MSTEGGPPGDADPSRTLLRDAAGATPWLALVALSLVTAGAVDPAAAALVAGCFLAAALLDRRAPAGPVPRPALVALLAAVAVCALQIVPLPEAVRAVVAPGPTSAREDLRALGLQGTWAPISVDVGATVLEGVSFAGLLALAVLFARRERPPLGARVAIGVLAALHGIAWLDAATGLRVFPLTTIEDPWNVGQERLRREAFAGWLVNRNHWAALGLLLWPLALGWGTTGTGRARRVAGTVGAAAVLLSVVATRSRAGLGIAAAQAAVGALVYARIRTGTARRAALAVAVLVVAGAALAYGRWSARVETTDVVDRARVYEATSRMALDSPVVGWGMGTFEAAFPAYQPDSLRYRYSHAHCDPLEALAGGGVFGLVLVLGVLATLVRGVRDARASGPSRLFWALGVAGAGVAACVEFPFAVPAIRYAWFGVLLAGPPRLRETR